jgi:hypothetical protein
MPQVKVDARPLAEQWSLLSKDALDAAADDATTQ